MAGATRRRKRGDLARYAADPVGYIEEVLGQRLWAKQIEIARALVEHKRVFVKASHSVGKSFLAGGLVNWFFDCYDPGLCITSAPTKAQVQDILWKEVRVQRPDDLRGALQPKAPRMQSSPDHFAVGYTARNDSGFQGRHEEFVLIVFDECVGVEGTFWDAAEGMMTGPNTYWLAICNPTDTSSRAYLECQTNPAWHVIEIAALDHPNIAAELAGESAPFPKAVRLNWLEGRLHGWCDRVLACDRLVGDLEFPPGSDVWYRPGPLFESRVLGRWPSQGSNAVWSDAAWAAANVARALDPSDALRIGCDKARFGDDFTSFVVRRGAVALAHETHNGWDNRQIAGRLKQLIGQYLQPGEVAQRVVCFVDDVQGGVIDLADGYAFVEVNSASRAWDIGGYPNRRSELWFDAVERVNPPNPPASGGTHGGGGMDLTRLSQESRDLLRAQLLAPTWRVDAAGRREVEKKDATKKRLGRSPDDADALNLCYSSGGELETDSALHRQIFARSDEEEGNDE